MLSNNVCCKNVWGYLAIGCSLLPRQADEESTTSLSRVALQQLEHVAARLGHAGHLGDHRQVVNDEGHLVLLVAGHGLCVAQQSES